MAAPSSKSSPSNQAVEGATAADVAAASASTSTTIGAVGASTEPSSTVATLKAPPQAAAAVAASTAKAPPASEEPTYEASELSDCYVLAKTFLNAGDFEQALVTIEEGIEGTRAVLMSLNCTDSEDEMALHPSLAPFHYLYGTTLLYSIEESNDQSMTMGGGDGSGGGDSEQAVDADDMQIAWENLEMARTILQGLVDKEQTDKRKLDLAQIFLRVGDLQRLNGRYTQAAVDYRSCLLYREDNPILGPYDRKIADVHYNLGLNYMMCVAESTAAAADDGEAAPPADPPTESVADMRRKIFYHYLACSKTLCGQLAFLANQDPDAFLAKAEADIPKFKSTGDEATDDLDHPKIVSLKLQAIRKHVATLTPPEEHQDLFANLHQLLQEIQETVDEAENSEKGVQEVSEMKAEISAAVAAQPGDDDDAGAGGGDGATTTVGFGSAAAAASTATAQPIMAIKKKKKRPVEDSKPAAVEDAKRPKNE